MPFSTAYTLVRFQSTLSMRRATGAVRPPVAVCLISIHALHEESETAFRSQGSVIPLISIHALHEESETGFTALRRKMSYFNPRSP